MVVTACSYGKKVSSLLEKISRFGRMYASPGVIFQDYEKLYDSQNTMTKAFKSIEPFTNKLGSVFGNRSEYNEIWRKIISPKEGNSSDANRIQKALNAYISQSPDNIVFDNLSPVKINEVWDSELQNDTEKNFVKDLAKSLNNFVKSFDVAGNANLTTLIRGCINNGILRQKIEPLDNQRWTGLGGLIGLLTYTGSGKNNVLGLLGVFDGSETKYQLEDFNGNKYEYRIKDLYNSDDAIMQNMFGLIFGNEGEHGNDPIIQNPVAYRNALKLMMKATDKDTAQGALTTITNKLLQYGAIGKLSSYLLNFVAGSAIGISCFMTGYFNMMSYKKVNSNEKIHNVLKQLGLKEEYFKLEGRDLKTWFIDTAQSYFGKGTNVLSLKDYTRDNNPFLNNEMYNWIMMGPANILGDTIWRGQYQYIAMDMAMQKLGITDINSFLYKTTAGGKRVPDLDAYALLMTTFINKMADVTGFPAIEGGGQVMQFDTSKGEKNRIVKTTANIALKMWSWMSNWGTNYVNNTYRILQGGMVNTYYSQEEKDNAYKGPGGKWVIRRYTRAIEMGNYTMPWEHAQALVSKQEFAMELMRFVAGVRNAYRLGNLACRDEETGELDWTCALKNFIQVAWLPGQAAQIAHPIIRGVLNTITDTVKYHNYFQDKDLGTTNAAIIEDSVITNIVKPMLRSLYALKIPFDIGERMVYNEQGFIDATLDAIIDSTDGIMYYISDELSSYVHSNGAYGPKNLLNNDNLIFGNVVELRDTMNELNRHKSIESIARDGVWQKLANLNSISRTFFGNAEWMFESSKADKMLYDRNTDEDILTMSKGEFTKDMLDDEDFMQYVWTNLTQDWQSYGANYKEGVRDSKYNKAEIDYFETLLKKDIDNITRKNPDLSDLEIYDAALKEFFQGTPTYEQIKEAIQAFDDAGQDGYAAYTDYLASASWLEETAGVKGLALVAEYRKRQLMEEAGLQYSSNATVDDKAKIEAIENQVAGELGPYLWLADRRQYENLKGRWFIQNHPEYENYDPFAGLTDKDGNYNVNGDVKQTGILGTALWASDLARTELILGDTNGYELSNVFTEHFGSVMDKDGNFDEVKAAQMVDSIVFFGEALEDSGKSPADIALILTPTLTKNLELFNYILSDDSEQSKKAREILGESGIDQIRGMLYDTYSAVNELPELLEVLGTKDFVDKILKSGSKSYKRGGGGSLYHGNNTRKNYDYYSKPASAFNSRGSKNLSKLANGYGNTGKYNRAGNYSAREFYFLNQRSYRNNVYSTRIAPDIPLSIGGFSKTTVKSKNPVSGFTTNIKPWEERATAKFGKSKNIVGGSKSRGPVSSFKA